MSEKCDICNKDFDDVLRHTMREHTLASIKCKKDGKRLDEHNHVELSTCLGNEDLANPFDEE